MIQQSRIQAGRYELNYREAGEGPPVLLLHGWPTSSFLWRNIIPHLASERRVIAPDLPGFGSSDKPLDVRYSFGFHADSLDALAAALKIERTAVVVHDLGGPIGLWWLKRRPELLERLVLLNTVVYPELSWAVKGFVAACRLPGVRSALTSQWGLVRALRLGLHDSRRLRADAIEGTIAPFTDPASRKALLRSACDLSPRGFAEIADFLRTIRVPVHILFGARDWILPDVAKTMARVKQDLPHASVEILEHCGHFLQEEDPDAVGRSLRAFLA